MVAYSRLRRRGRLVDVHARDGGAGRGGRGAPDRVVEEQDARGAGDGVEEEALHFRVVGFADVGVVGEGVLGAWRELGQGREGVVVEREGRFASAYVVDGHEVVGVAEVALELARWWGFDVVVWSAAVGGGRVEFQGGGDGAVRDIGCGGGVVGGGAGSFGGAVGEGLGGGGHCGFGGACLGC